MLTKKASPVTAKKKHDNQQVTDGEQTAPPSQKAEKAFLWAIFQRPLCFAGNCCRLQCPELSFKRINFLSRVLANRSHVEHSVSVDIS